MSPDSNPTGHRRADAQRNRDALLAAAQRLFDERGPDVALDEIARTAGVANATLYRHFANRADLLAAVYAGEVDELDRLSLRLLAHHNAGQALTDWLRAFVHHVVDKRALALAIPDEPAGDRATLFDDWHATMQGAAQRLLDRARAAGVVRRNVTAIDLVALAGGIALSGLAERRLNAVLDLIRDGYAP